jgi:hypothetical protein
LLPSAALRYDLVLPRLLWIYMATRLW